MCREIDIDIRNLIAEKAIAYMKVPCEHAYFGCKVEVQFREKENVSYLSIYMCTSGIFFSKEIFLYLPRRLSVP